MFPEKVIKLPVKNLKKAWHGKAYICACKTVSCFRSKSNEEIFMDIFFCGPAVMSPEGGVSYRIKVGDKSMFCRMTLEALRIIDPENGEIDPMSQFQASKTTLLAIAEQKIRKGQIEDTVVWVTGEDVEKEKES